MIITPQMFESLEAALLVYAKCSMKELVEMKGTLAKLAISAHGSPSAREAIMTELPAKTTDTEKVPIKALTVVTNHTNCHSRIHGAHGPGAVAEIPPC